MSVMEQSEIQALLPHRYPFLLVDRVLELEPDRRIVGIKNVTVNEPFFQGHFPGRPVMPGVLILGSDGAGRRDCWRLNPWGRPKSRWSI